MRVSEKEVYSRAGILKREWGLKSPSGAGMGLRAAEGFYMEEKEKQIRHVMCEQGSLSLRAFVFLFMLQNITMNFNLFGLTHIIVSDRLLWFKLSLTSVYKLAFVGAWNSRLKWGILRIIRVLGLVNLKEGLPVHI